MMLRGEELSVDAVNRLISGHFTGLGDVRLENSSAITLPGIFQK